MTTTSPIDDAQLFAPPPQAKRSTELGQEDFLTLMITQFQNQDPFEPMDNGEFLGQLAQFSTVNGIDSLNSAFAGLSGALQDEQALQAANLVGRSVLAISERGYVGQGSGIEGAVELAGAASDVQVDIVNRNGELVKTISLGEQQAGLARFSWDGTDASGDRAPAGEYELRARVVRGANVESAQTLIRADVESVTLGQFGAGMTLNLQGGGTLALNQIYQIT